MTIPLADAPIREQALAVEQSFIVQAPAGSGKTALLIQRILALLAVVQKHPEEVLAITFTNKAAMEMRYRLIQALAVAADSPCPEDAYGQKNWQLAQAVLRRNQMHGWDLLNNPNRLRIMTIDAFCHSLARQMPLLTEFGATLQTNLLPEPYYRQAIENLLQQPDPSVQTCVSIIMDHLDNNYEKTCRLFTAMLAMREQWLPHLMGATHTDVRQHLEAALTQCYQMAVSQVLDHLTWEQMQQCAAIMAITRENLCQLDTAVSFLTSDPCLDFPSEDPHDYCHWQHLLFLLFTKDGKWRKRLTKNEGLPPNQKQAKQQLSAIIEAMQQDPILAEAWQQLRLIPPPRYSECQWQVIDALIAFLPLCAAQLKYLFQQQGECDFNEIAMQALHALGDVETPTDLALRLDHQINHILVDEFQDTSVLQCQLLERLVAGWQEGDGRSLFLVGDPMQSIYRFRQAEVGLFLQAQQSGINHVKLIPLQLNVNFRSAAAVVDWVNHALASIFPAHSNPATGAVCFSRATAAREDIKGQVMTHWAANQAHEAALAIDIIKQHRQQDPRASVAVLAQSRRHLIDLIDSLQQHHMPFQAVEIESLADQQVVLDCVSLCRALFDLTDRVAWLSVLRAPWCGLSLADLTHVAEQDELIWQAINREELFEKLSDDGRQRLKQLQAVIHAQFEERQRVNAYRWIKQTWHALQGPQVLHTQAELIAANAFFDLLLNIGKNESLDLDSLLANLRLLFAKMPCTDENPIQLMTIHKSKGLEFDCVILPGLSQRPRVDQNPLLAWAVLTREESSTDLLLAPIQLAHHEPDPLFNYCRNIEKQKAQEERKRLLYVAATRAKTHLHLIASLAVDDDKGAIQSPSPQSLMGLLWPIFTDSWPVYSSESLEQIAHNLTTELAHQQTRAEVSFTDHNVLIRKQHVSLNPINTPLREFENNNRPALPDPESDWIRLSGVIIHRLLQQLAERPATMTLTEAWQRSEANLRQLLQYYQVDPSYVESTQTLVQAAIEKTLHCQHAQWILQSHQQAHNEWSLISQSHHASKQFIIDRSFVDEQNNRWIIDYKTTQQTATNDDPEGFEQAISQVENYARLVQTFDKRPIYLGLYYPLLQKWYSWEAP